MARMFHALMSGQPPEGSARPYSTSITKMQLNPILFGKLARLTMPDSRTLPDACRNRLVPETMLSVASSTSPTTWVKSGDDAPNIGTTVVNPLATNLPCGKLKIVVRLIENDAPSTSTKSRQSRPVPMIRFVFAS